MSLFSEFMDAQPGQSRPPAQELPTRSCFLLTGLLTAIGAYPALSGSLGM